jgi:hypothetical protein
MSSILEHWSQEYTNWQATSSNIATMNERMKTLGQEGVINFGRAGDNTQSSWTIEFVGLAWSLWGSPCLNFDPVTPGDVAWVAEKKKNENLEASEIYAQTPY